ncbi:restriction endonuclease PLD domain-containing protein [Weissella confusa]|uniref:restriction endonuclease PLD domain-containing protein n=1 Tax=Weissella confusa TaxID=1583 RepID=UPI00107EF581|nr:restriction endonuclease PLD domain-containing protein [Weissella confusa]TGE80056.1 NgoFVII family restriction endonuclease [Weissella confusa]
MTIWDRYTQDERESYIEYLKIYGALSGLFNQKASTTGAPYLDSKFQETVYAKSFNSEDVDIGNTPHDIKSIFGSESVGIGIKTWLSSKPSFQKVMQLKKYKTTIDKFNDPSTSDQLAYKISEIKNERLMFDYKRLGLKQDGNVYHYVTRDTGLLTLNETSYPLVDINNVVPGNLTNKSFNFSDGQKEYKYTFGDSQIWMKFEETQKDTSILDKIPVSLIDDPFLFLKNAYNNYTSDNGILVSRQVTPDYLYLPLYSYRSKTVPESSGLNAWNGKPKTSGSTTLRPRGEAYIPIPTSVWKKKPYWVDPKVDMRHYNKYKQDTGKSSYEINLHLPDGTIFPALFGQTGFKALETSPQSILGIWILNVLGITNPQRVKYDQPAINVVTMDSLELLGVDSVKLWHQDPNNLKEVWIDFAELGSFEEFMNDEL